MKNLSSWLFLLIAVVWLLPLIKVDFLEASNIGASNIGQWIAVIALAIIGITGLMNK